MEGNAMPKNLSHEDIAQRFIDAKVIDFTAMGNFIKELGPTLAVGSQGWYGVNIGRFNVLACSMPAADVARLVGNLGSAGLTARALEAAAEANLPR
jgi:hypothetical protein